MRKPSMFGASVVARVMPLAAVLLATGLVQGGAGLHDSSREAIGRLKADHPAVIVQEGPAGVRALIGPMSVGRSPGAAAERFASEYGDALGVNRKEIHLASETPVGKRFTVSRYSQMVDGLAVENSDIRVVSLHGHGNSQVVFANARVIGPISGDFAPDSIQADGAAEIARRQAPYAGLTRWTTPELVIFAGDDAPIAPVRAWKVNGGGEILGKAAAFTFFIDASSGEIVRVRDIILEGGSGPRDLYGHIEGYSTPGLLPDTDENPPVKGPLFGVRARDQSTGDADFTDESGNYFIPVPGLGLGHVVESDLIGEWASALNYQGDEFHFESSDLPANFNFNASPDEFGTAQVNAFIHATNAHDFFKTYQPQWTGLDITLGANTNIPAVCNAFFDPTEYSINFYNAGEGVTTTSPAYVVDCPNTAYSSVISHEYGHFVHWQLGFQFGGAFSEGYGDSLAVLLHDDPQIGRDFFTYVYVGGVGPVRDIEAANKQFPCAGEAHDCGQVLAGVWWDISQEMQASLGAVAGLDGARDLFTSWSLMTLGPDDGQAAGQRTAVEILTADDDDGDLCTSTPHGPEICAGLEGHNIACPVSDCNENSEIDACDIQSGYSNDCNGNIIPDTCEIASGVEADCNENQVPDSCDIDAGWLDCCGQVGVPDACEHCAC